MTVVGAPNAQILLFPCTIKSDMGAGPPHYRVGWNYWKLVYFSIQIAVTVSFIIMHRWFMAMGQAQRDLC